MVDYVKSLATAKRLIQEAGRQVTILQLASTSAEPTQPWASPTTPRATPDASTMVYAVAVPPSSAQQLGLGVVAEDLMARVSQILICEPGTDDPDNLHLYHIVQDGGHDHKIVFAERLRPADTTLLYYLGLER